MEDDRSSATITMDADLARALVQRRPDFIADLSEAVAPFEFNAVATLQGVQLTGDRAAVAVSKAVFESISNAEPAGARRSNTPTQGDITSIVRRLLKTELCYRLDGLTRLVQPASFAQVAYVDGLLSSHEDLILGIGPTGTGKTHLAVAVGLYQGAGVVGIGLLVQYP